MSSSPSYELRYCKRCIMPSSRPGLVLDSEGVCNACRWHERKKTIDWDARARQLSAIASWARSVTKAPWDCVLGVSGGKDSLWQAHMLRDQFGFNPLLVEYVSSDGTELGRRNAENMVRCGFTLISYQPNPVIEVRLARKSFLEYGNIAKYSEFSLFAAPFRAAVDYDIPLVFFGENPALEAGDSNTTTLGWDANGVRYTNTLGGGGVDIWLGDGIEPKHLIPYQLPPESELQAWGGRSVFMSYFLDWSGWQNAVFSIRRGLQTIDASYEDMGIHYKHNSLDSDNGSMLNAMLKHNKFGFGSVTEFAAYDVRAERMTRREAAALAKALDGRCHNRYVKDFCAWVDLDESIFWQTVEKFRGPMWRRSGTDAYLSRPIWLDYNDIDDVDIDALIERVSTIRAAREPDAA